MLRGLIRREDLQIHCVRGGIGILGGERKALAGMASSSRRGPSRSGLRREHPRPLRGE